MKNQFLKCLINYKKIKNVGKKQSNISYKKKRTILNEKTNKHIKRIFLKNIYLIYISNIFINIKKFLKNINNMY